MTGLWFGGAEVILPLGHAFPLLVSGAGHVGHLEVHLGGGWGRVHRGVYQTVDSTTFWSQIH